MTQSVEQLKQEISDVYLKEFKKELGWLKSLTLLPIEKKVKNILIGKTRLPDKFNQIEEFGWWKDIINFVTPSIATQIFDFMKEKSQEIERRKTTNELLELKNKILGGGGAEATEEGAEATEEGGETTEEGGETTEEGAETTEEGTETTEEGAEVTEEGGETTEEGGETTEEGGETTEEGAETTEGSSSLGIGARFALYGSAGVRITGILSNKIDQNIMKNSLDAGKIKETINGAIKQLKDQRDCLGSRLSDAQIKTIDKHISKMEEGLKVPDSEISTVLKERQKLGDKFPGELLNSAGLNVKQINKIEKLAGKLQGKSVEEIRTILKENGINDVGDELLQTLGKATSPSEIKSITKILRHGSKFNRFMQTLSGAMLIDVAFSGLDVRMFIEQRKEAELIAKVNQTRAANKNNQAWTQLGIGVSSVAIEAIIIGLYLGGSGGPVGAAVGVAIGAVTGVASMAADSLYFDVKDFYLQNKDDFLRQKKSRITEAILQGIHNKKEGNTTINEKIGNLGLDAEEKENSTEAACRALMFLDELDGEEFGNYAPFWEYLNKGKTKEEYLKEATEGLPEKDAEEVRLNFSENRTKINNKISRRITYMREIFKNNDIIDAIKKGNGIQTINELCVESRIYAEIGQEKRQGNISRKSYKSNLSKLKSEYFKDFQPEKLKKLENLKENNNTLFQELISTANYYSLLKENETDNNYTENVKLVQKYQERLKLTELNSDKIGLSIEDTHRNMRFIESIIKADFDLEKIHEFMGNNEKDVIGILNRNCERRGTMEISDDVWQNVLYRFAKELYNYGGENSKEGIMSFFDEGSDGVHGIYYNNGWKVNSDWLPDHNIQKEGIDKVFSSEEEVKKYVEIFMKRNFTIETQTGKEGTVHTSNVETIDTETESIDKDLIKEFKRVFEEILTQELLERTEQNQTKIKNEIIDFVKKYSNGEYLELPYYLIIKARRAGLGNLERQFLKQDNNELVMCTIPTELGNNPLGAKINYITKARESYTAEEKAYIDRVEEAQKNLTDLFNFQGGLLWKGEESDLDIPREVKGIVSDKYKERNDFKERLLLYSPNVASNMIEQYNQYAEYFENLYRGMLIALTTYKISNDIDSYSLFQQIEYFGNSNYFGENGEIKTDLDIDFFKNEDIKSFYNDQIKKQKIKFLEYNGKDEKESTIEELRNSEESDEREIARRASNTIIMTIAEQSMINKSSSGEITSINIGGNQKDKDTTKGIIGAKGLETESIITNRLKKIRGRVLIDKSKIQEKEQKIQPLSIEESETAEESINLEKIIEDTAKEIERQNERGNIIYDPEKKSIKSRGEETKIDISNRNIEIIGASTKGLIITECKLEGLEDILGIKEGLWLANFANRAKHKYKGKKIEVGKGKHVVGKDTIIANGTRIISREALNNNLPSFNSDEGREKVVEWLQKQCGNRIQGEGGNASETGGGTGFNGGLGGGIR